jgi:hypothetical protein
MNVELTARTWMRINHLIVLAAALTTADVPRMEIIRLLVDGPLALKQAMDQGVLNVTPIVGSDMQLRLLCGVAVTDDPLLSPSRWRWFGHIGEGDLDLHEAERADLLAAADQLDNVQDLDVPDVPPDEPPE